jgi:hypothetical protein
MRIAEWPSGRRNVFMAPGMRGGVLESSSMEALRHGVG